MRTPRSTSRRPELLLDLIALDRKSPEPLHRQLYLRLIELIMDGSLPFDGRLPSSRALAQKINVSRNTVVSAYQQLEVEGYVQAQRGSQTFVATAPTEATTHRIEGLTSAKDPLSKRGRQMISQPMNFFGLADRRSLQPGLADVTHFPFVTLRRIIAHRLQAGGDYVFGYQHISGYPPLKRAIARYLAAARGVRCEPDQVVITNGAQPAFDLLARILTDPGDSVWMEDPGYPAAQSAFVAAGASIMPLPVSAEGWELFAPPEERLRAIYVTPSCQSPLGVTMRLDHRLRRRPVCHSRPAHLGLCAGRRAPSAPSGGDLKGRWVRGLVTGFVLAVVLLPIYWMVATSLKTNREIRQDATLYPHAPTFDSYVLLFKDKGFSSFLTNSIVVTAASVVIAVAFGSLGAYAIARFRLRFGLERKVGLALLTLRIVPAVVILVPVYLLILQLKLIDTWTGLILVYTAFNITFCVWMMESFFHEIPVDLEEAAMVDGDSRLTAFIRIALPLAAPRLAATAIFAVIATFNEFLFALALTATPRAMTMPRGTGTLIGRIDTDWSSMAAAGVVGALPIVVFALLVQRYLVRGLTMGAVK